MKATYFDKDGKVTETKDFGEVVSDDVLTYNDEQLFFEIPESIMKAARSKTDKLERLYLLDQLRFLIKYDFELYTKSEMCAKQEAELSCFLKECGCKDFEEFFGLQSYDYKPDNAYSTRRDELLSVLRIHQRMGMADIRHHLISIIKSNNIQYSRVVRNPHNIDAWYRSDFIYSNELTPEIGFLMSLLAPLGDISEKQMLPGNIFKDNKFVLSVARALYRTKGIERSTLYSFLRLYLPTNKRHVLPTGTIGFAASIDMEELNETFCIKSFDELGDETASYTITKAELASLFNVAITEKPLLKEIESLFCNEFDRYKERQQEQVANSIKRGIMIYDNNWTRFLGSWYKNLETEYKSNCNEENLYTTPYCLYGIILRYENPEEMLYISEPMTRDVVFCYTKNPKIKRIPMYGEMCSLNYIKSKAKGDDLAERNISSSKQHHHLKDTNKTIDSQKDAELDDAIKKAIDYIDPIINEKFLTAKTSPEEFRELFHEILNISAVKHRMNEHSLKSFTEFNLRLVFNIIGLLIYYGYIRKRSATGIDEAMKEVYETYTRHREEITNYNETDSYGYIRKNKLIPIIEDFIKQKNRINTIHI